MNTETGITLPMRYLKAAAIFSSRDETRFTLCTVAVEIKDHRTLLVATDGRRIFMANPFEETEDVTADGLHLIPAKLIAMAVASLGSGMVRVTWSGKESVKLTSVESGNSLSGQGLEAKYPDWRQVTPRAGATPRASFALNAALLDGYLKADKMLGGDGAVEIRASDDFGGISIEGISSKSAVWFGVLMPVRRELKGGLPTWIQ